MDDARPDGLDPAAQAELAALADGTLPPARRAEAEARVAASPALRAALERQRHGTQATDPLRALRAPDGLAERIDAAAGGAGREPRRRRAASPRRAPRARRGAGLRWPGPAAAALAAVAAIAVVLAITGGGGGAEPEFADAVALGERPPSAPAPRAAGRGRLDYEVGGVRYPDWRRDFGWRAVGARDDAVGARKAGTVFYARAGREIAYTVVASPPLPVPEGERSERDGTRYVVRRGDRTVVTWRQGGATCVLSGRGVPAATLLALAGWSGGASRY